MRRRQITKFAAAAVTALALSPAAHAQTYPTKPIRFIVGFVPGGGNDLLARTVGPKMSEQLNQPVVIDNKPGAGGNVAAELVARAPGDGYTILVMSSSHPIAKLLKPELTYDPIADFTPLGRLAEYGYILVVNSEVKARSVKELVALARAEPGKLNYATPGNGTGSHLAGELFKIGTGTDIAHIPYKGAGPAVTDLMGGRVQMMFPAAAAVMGQLKSGKLIAIATTGTRRASALPDVPTVAESGYPNFSAASWYGVVGPAKIPAAIADTLNKSINGALQGADVKERLATEGVEPAPLTREQFVQLIRADHEKWGKVIAATGIKGD